MSFNDPVRLSFEGDRAAAYRYIRPARALLLKLAREVSNAGSAHARRRYVLGDGAIIELTLAGLQTNVHIITPEAEGARVRVQEHFVVWPRAGDPPEGLDDEHPQLMIRADEDEFTTLFYSPDIEGYEDFEGNRGTYRTDRGEVVFPDGVRHAGNIDWRSNDGLRVSWYGPSSRYFVEPYVQPRAQYGTKVFMLGQVLFDSDEYMAQSDTTFPERWVMGAAVSPDLKTLYVVHADLPVGYTPGGTSDINTAEFGNPLPAGGLDPALPVPIVVCSYALVRDPTATSAMNFSVEPESREVLASRTLEGAYNPWFFNGSATLGLSVGIPNPMAAVYMGDSVRGMPAASGPLYEFNGAIVERTVSAPVGGSGVMAVDFDGDTLRELVLHRRQIGDSQDAWVFGLGSTEWVGRSFARRAPHGWRSMEYEWRKLLWADLRSGAFVFFHTSGLHNHPNVGGEDARADEVELWSGPVLLDTAPLVQNPDPDEHATLPWTLVISTTGSAPPALFLEPALDAPYAPIFAMYALCAAAYNQGIVTSRRTSYDGLHGGYLSLHRDPAEMFGYFSTFGMTARLAVASRSRPGSATNIPDADGRRWTLGAAGYDGVVMYSGYDIFGSRNHDSFHMAGAVGQSISLPELTGVEGDKARYHPIWLLGTLPSREVA